MTTKVHNQLHFVQHLGEPACTFTAIVCGFTFVYSPMTLALIGVVRYCKVVPRTAKNFDLSERRFYGMAVAVFTLATIFAFLPVLKITGRYTYSPSHGVCFAEWHPDNEVFRSIFYILVIGLAFPVLTICYFLLFRALRKHNKNITEGVGMQSCHGRTTDGKEDKVDCLVIENTDVKINDKEHTQAGKTESNQTEKKISWIKRLSTMKPPQLYIGSKKVNVSFQAYFLNRLVHLFLSRMP